MHENNTKSLPAELSLPQTTKTTMFFLLSFMFLLQQNQRTRRWNRFCPESGGGGRVAQTMYTRISTCENDKIKKFFKTNKYF
jgi:hypothetical protein